MLKIFRNKMGSMGLKWSSMALKTPCLIQFWKLDEFLLSIISLLGVIRIGLPVRNCKS